MKSFISLPCWFSEVQNLIIGVMSTFMSKKKEDLFFYPLFYYSSMLVGMLCRLKYQSTLTEFIFEDLNTISLVKI